MLERIDCEPFWLRGPAFADELIWREAFEGLEPSSEVVGVEEVREVTAQLIVVFIVIPSNRRVLDRAVHALDLPVGPRMVDLRAAMLDAIFLASQAEHVC